MSYEPDLFAPPEPPPRPRPAPRLCTLCPSPLAFFGFGPAKTVKGHADAVAQTAWYCLAHREAGAQQHKLSSGTAPLELTA